MRRILLVDDDPHVGQAIRVWFQHHGRAATANDGADRLAALRQRRPRSDDPRCDA
ncbi:MAG TPA: response regulator [Bradyrhizobium sp.]|nr:response regulator [Bradyrhizobium sp.]